jgi:hypothetical protein
MKEIKAWMLAGLIPLSLLYSCNGSGNTNTLGESASEGKFDMPFSTGNLRPE